MDETEYVESESENIPFFDAPQGMALVFNYCRKAQNMFIASVRPSVRNQNLVKTKFDDDAGSAKRPRKTKFGPTSSIWYIGDLGPARDSGFRDEKTHGANVDVEQCNPYGTSDISHNNNRIRYQLVAFPCTWVKCNGADDAPLSLQNCFTSVIYLLACGTNLSLSVLTGKSYKCVISVLFVSPVALVADPFWPKFSSGSFVFLSILTDSV